MAGVAGDPACLLEGLWLKIAKNGSGIETVTYAEALEVAPCSGRIDGQKDAVDDRWWLQRFRPREPRSRWSKTNRRPGDHADRSGADAPRRASGGGAGTSRRPVGGGLRLALEGHGPWT